MLLQRRGSILAVDARKDLPDYLEQGLDYVVTTRFGRDGLSTGPLLISEEEVYIAFLTARFGLEIVFEALRAVGGASAAMRILEADNIPPEVQEENPEFQPEGEIPDDLLSYQQAVIIDSDVDRAVRKFSFRFGVHFALWVLKLFGEDQWVKTLHEAPLDMSWNGQSSVSIGIAGKNRLEISLNAASMNE